MFFHTFTSLTMTYSLIYQDGPQLIQCEALPDITVTSVVRPTKYFELDHNRENIFVLRLCWSSLAIKFFTLPYTCMSMRNLYSLFIMRSLKEILY